MFGRGCESPHLHFFGWRISRLSLLRLSSDTSWVYARIPAPRKAQKFARRFIKILFFFWQQKKNEKDWPPMPIKSSVARAFYNSLQSDR